MFHYWSSLEPTQNFFLMRFLGNVYCSTSMRDPCLVVSHLAVVLRVTNPQVGSISGGEVRHVPELPVVQDPQLLHLVVERQLLPLHHVHILHRHLDLIYYSLNNDDIQKYVSE
jgi:hypothetical protein